MSTPTRSKPSVLPPAHLAHVVLRTAKFKPMVAFYKAFLGARASHENDHLSFLTYDEEHHRIAIATLPGMVDASRDRTKPGLEHVAFTYDTLEDLLTSYKQRKVLGILPVWCVNHGVTLNYQDPDQNQIEVQVDNFKTAEEANAYMQSEAFAKNSLGANFDPEDLIRRLASGEDEQELRKRPDVGDRDLTTMPKPPPPVVKESYEPVDSVA